MSICPNCGNEFLEGDLFCGSCGQNLQEIESADYDEEYESYDDSDLPDPSNNRLYNLFFYLIVLLIIGFLVFAYFKFIKKDKYTDHSTSNTNQVYDGYQQKTVYWGAFAYDEVEKSLGSSWGYNSKSGAESRALQECNRSKCKLIGSFNNCAAFANSDDAWGWASNDNRYQAETNALKTCNNYSYSKTCGILKSICSYDK